MLKILLWPFLKKYFKLFIAMMLITAIAITAYTGLSGAFLSLKLSLDTYVEDYQYEDITILTDPTAANIKTKLQEIEGVKAVSQRIVHDTQIIVPGSGLLTGRFYYYQPDEFQKIYVWEENVKEGEYNIDVEKKFAQYNDLNAGDYIEVNVNGNFEKVRIGRVISSPECFINTLDSYTLGESMEFGLFFVSSEDNFFGKMYNKLANQFAILVEPGYDQHEILGKAEEILSKRTEIISSNVYEDSVVNRRIEVNTSALKTLSTLIPAAFYITMICVCSLFLIQIIRQSRKDIGILKSQGFNSNRIRLMFCIASLIVEFTGCVLGYLFGFCVSRFSSSLFLSYLVCPVNITTIDKNTTVIAFVITLLAGQLSAIIGTASISKIKPSEALEPEVSSNTKVPGYFEKLPSRIKLSLVSMTRNKKNFLFSVICIAATIVIIFSSIEYEISKNRTVYEVFDRRVTHDCELLYNESISEEDIDSISDLSSITDVELAKYYSRTISFNGNEKSVIIQALSPDSELLTVPGTGKENIKIPSHGIVLESHTAEKLGASLGSIVEIDGVEFEVTALSNQYSDRRMLMSLESADLLGTPDRWVLLCNCTSGEGIVDRAKDINGFVNATFRESVRKCLVDALFNHTIAVWIVIIFAVMIGFTIIFNTTQTNLFKMRKEISVLRSIGFQISDISSMWFFQTIIQFAVALVIGFPLGEAVARYAIADMSTSGTEYPFVRTPWLYIITFSIVFFYILISHLRAMSTVKKWNIAENVKEKD